MHDAAIGLPPTQHELQKQPCGLQHVVKMTTHRPFATLQNEYNKTQFTSLLYCKYTIQGYVIDFGSFSATS